MNSFEQLRQEAKTKETIRNYRREHPPVAHKRLLQVKDEFGATHPGEIEMWRTVWDDCNISYDEGIPEAYLPEAVKGALGLTDKKAIDAVSIGKEFDLLLEAEPVDSVELQYRDDEDDTILRLVSPQERPDLYCENVEQYADREKWSEIWAMSGFDGSFAISKEDMIDFCINLLGIDTKPEAKAAINVGEMSQAIIRQDDGYVLSGERAESYWLDIWESRGYDYEDTISKNQLQVAIVARETVAGNEAQELLEDAVERGELYHPEDADEDELAINDPSSEEGPEIERKIGIDTDDDAPDDDSDQSDAEQSDGDSPDTTAPSEDEAAETSPSENGTAPGSDNNSSDGQTASVDDGDTGGDTTPDNSDTDADEDDNSSAPAVEIEDFKNEVEQPTTEQLLEQNDDMRELEASIKARPPYEFRVRKAMKAAIEFFHDHLDETIPENVEWNQNNPDAGYRKPETPREYFRDPQYDDDPAAAYQINPRPDIAATKDGPGEYDISGAASSRLRDDTAINESSSNNSEAGDSETIIPYNLKTRNNRGWSPETIQKKKLGWAPRDMDSLREHLRSERFTDREMLATGLFNLTDDDKLTPFIQARYILPYFDEEGEPVFLISRSTDTKIQGGKDGDGPDFHSESKYTKPKESQLKEPIYGSQTIQEGQPLVITEGIADAITAHEHGIPCISPVTKQFKPRDYPFLERLILENDVPQVFIIQNADRPATSVQEAFMPEYNPDYDTTAGEYKSSPREVGDDEQSSDLHDALTAKQKGPGFEGALRAAQHLDVVARRAASKNDPGSSGDQYPVFKWETDSSNPDEIGSKFGGSGSNASGAVAVPADTPLRAFETYLIELPRFGEMKYDLDDYLSDNMGQLAPPAIWAAQVNDTSNDTPDWMQQLKTEGNIEYSDLNEYEDVQPHRYPPVDTDREEFNSNSRNDTLKPTAGILNYLPTIGPKNGTLSPNVSQASSTVTPGNLDGAPDHKQHVISKELFSLKFRDVTGLNKGFCGKSPFDHYGDSEDHFCVISDYLAYCYKRNAAYTPSIAVLVAEGERRADDPGGIFSPKEIFVYWRYLKDRGILDAKIPREALVHYALEHGIATRDDLVDPGAQNGRYVKLPLDKKRDTLAKIGDNHAFDITWENYDIPVKKPDSNGDSGTPRAADKTCDGESDSSGSAERSSGQSGGSGEQSSAGESDGKESATSSASGGESSNETSQSTGVEIGSDISNDSPGNEADQPTGDDGDEEIPNTTTNADGLDTGYLADEVDNFDNPNAGDGEQECDSGGDGGGTTKFHTYDDSNATNPSVDVDIDAVAQFIDHHTTVGEELNDEMKTPTDTMISVFTEWAEINGIDLNKLDPDIYISNRKGNLTSIITDSFDVEKGNQRIGDDLVKCYYPIALDENIKDIIE